MSSPFSPIPNPLLKIAAYQERKQKQTPTKKKKKTKHKWETSSSFIFLLQKQKNDALESGAQIHSVSF